MEGVWGNFVSSTRRALRGKWLATCVPRHTDKRYDYGGLIGLVFIIIYLRIISFYIFVHARKSGKDTVKKDTKKPLIHLP